MSLFATVDNAGRILVPLSVRRRLKLTPGSRLRLDVVAEREVQARGFANMHQQAAHAS